MKLRKTLLTSALGAAVAIAAPSVNAATVHLVGAGASGLFSTAAAGAFSLAETEAKKAGGSAHHYSIKGKAELIDTRSSAIPAENGNLWVVWSDSPSGAVTDVWAYLSVDSVAANRAFFAAPRAELQIDPATGTLPGQNLIPAAFFGGQADEKAFPAAVLTALNRLAVSAAFTEVRPEDAKFAQTRAVSALDAKLDGLGYGAGPGTLIGTPIESGFGTGAATHPVDFNITGTDPFTKKPVPPSKTIPIGAAPIVFVVNKSNANGLGKTAAGGAPVFNNLTDAEALTLFSGTNANTSVFGVAGAPKAPVTAILRDPLSGAGNATEFTVFRTAETPAKSQEENVGEPTPGTSANPLNKPALAGGGKRVRAIGTGEEINGVASTKDSIGYTFFSFGNVASIAGPKGVGAYLQLDGVDPINAKYTNGALPLVAPPQPVTITYNGKQVLGFDNFHNLRNGAYRAWGLDRVVTDPTNKDVPALVAQIRLDADTTVPDFVPFNPNFDPQKNPLATFTINGKTVIEPGLQLYRSHYTQSGVAPSNGLFNANGAQTAESGGDVGGKIEEITFAPGVLNQHQ